MFQPRLRRLLLVIAAMMGSILALAKTTGGQKLRQRSPVIGDRTLAAKRGYYSGSTYCYYRCPTLTYYGESPSSVTASEYDSTSTQCKYVFSTGGTSSISVYCNYNDVTGANTLNGGDKGTGSCPSQAAGPYCEAETGSEYFRKRSTGRTDPSVRRNQVSAGNLRERSDSLAKKLATKGTSKKGKKRSKSDKRQIR